MSDVQSEKVDSGPARAHPELCSLRTTVVVLRLQPLLFLFSIAIDRCDIQEPPERPAPFHPVKKRKVLQGTMLVIY
jgi:hypothetical protein